MNLSAPPRDTWCLRFLSSGMRGRRIALASGANTLGAAPECEVLLPDTDARARHLVLTAGEVALTVRRIDDAPVALNGAPMAAERRSLVPGDVLRVGGIDVQIDRDYAQAPAGGEGPDSMFLGAEGGPGADRAPAPRRASGAPATLRGVAVGALVLAAAGFAAWRPAPAREAAARAGAPDAARLQAVLADYPEVTVQPPDARGSTRLGGFVESSERRQALVRSLGPLGAAVQVEVTAMDEVIARAREFVADPGIAISYGGRGHLRLSGASEQAASHDRVQHLAHDLYPTLVVDDEVHYRVAAAARPAPAPDWASRLPARVVSITEDGHGMRFVQLANGDRYFEGAPLRAGGLLDHIRPEDLPPPKEARDVP